MVHLLLDSDTPQKVTVFIFSFSSSARSFLENKLLPPSILEHTFFMQHFSNACNLHSRKYMLFYGFYSFSSRKRSD